MNLTHRHDYNASSFPEKTALNLVFGCWLTTIGGMIVKKKFVLWFVVGLLLCLLVSCRDDQGNGSSDSVPTEIPTEPTATGESGGLGEAVPTTVVDSAEPLPPPSQSNPERPILDRLVLAVDVPDRTGRFASFDENGTVVGLDADVADALALQMGIPVQLVVTPFDGIMRGIRSGVFDGALSAITADDLEDGIVLTDPYLSLGQVAVVRANEERAITDQLVVAEGSGSAELINQVSDFSADVAIVDQYTAQYYTDRYYQRIKTIGSVDDPANWLSSRDYSIAVSSENAGLLDWLNSEIATFTETDTQTDWAESWLIQYDSIDSAGESLIGTPDDRVLVGLVGKVGNLDPADPTFDLVNWEIKTNIMSGLLGYDADNEIIPVLAESLPEISTDGKTYTFTLREGLAFPDGTLLTAQTVRDSFIRSTLAGNWLLNEYLKNSDGDNFADEDSIRVIDDRTIQLILNDPASIFSSILTTPPTFVTAPTCGRTLSSIDDCTGIGPYLVTKWEPTLSLRLETNPQWPLTTPKSDKIELRFHTTSQELADAVRSEGVDVAWQGLSRTDINALTATGLEKWVGPGGFKSYMVFEQSNPPWDDPEIRKAAALAIDRTALAELFGDDRLPLFGPVVDGVPGGVPASPQRDLTRSINILTDYEYTPDNPLEIDLWFLNDGRYSSLEAEYAALIAEQLEETNIFQVTLKDASWPTYSTLMTTCQLPAFLLGWPPTTQPRYTEALYWMSYFIINTETVCSNYESEDMDALLDDLLKESDPQARTALYESMQNQWAEDLPTLDLTQETRDAVSLPKLDSLIIDAFGIMHYDSLEK